MRHGLYGVFAQQNGRNVWAMERNKRRALRLGRKLRGFVMAMPLPETASWDAPTFRACSDLLADFRSANKGGV